MVNDEMRNAMWEEGFLFSKALFEGDLDVNVATNYPVFDGFTEEEISELSLMWNRGYDAFRESVL